MYLDGSGAFEAGSDSWILGWRATGAGVDAAADLGLALGYPLLVAKSGKGPTRAGLKKLHARRMDRRSHGGVLPEAAIAPITAAFWTDTPPTLGDQPVDDLGAFVLRCFEHPLAGTQALLMAEAVWGTRAVSAAATEHLESVDAEAWDTRPFSRAGAGAIKGLGAMVDRLASGERDAVRARLVALLRAARRPRGAILQVHRGAEHDPARARRC